MKIRGAGLLCTLASVLTGCGSAASFDYEKPSSGETVDQPLARMRGSTQGDAADVNAEDLRVALVWFPVIPSPDKVQNPQRVNHHIWLGSFEIEITNEPPRRAVEGADIGRYAKAEVVLYEDRNHNDELDLVSRGATSPDRVVGRALGTRVWWLHDGMPAPADQRGYLPVVQGWSFTYGPIEAAPEADLCAPGRASPDDTWRPVCQQRGIKEPVKDVSVQSPFVITLSNDPKLQSYACLGFWGTSSDKSDEWPDTTAGWNSPEVRYKICNRETCDSDGTGPALDLPVAGRSVDIQCNSDKTTYYWKDCEPDPKLCGTVFCHEGKGARDPRPGVAPPDNWPAKCR